MELESTIEVSKFTSCSVSKPSVTPLGNTTIGRLKQEAAGSGVFIPVSILGKILINYLAVRCRPITMHRLAERGMPQAPAQVNLGNLSQQLPQKVRTTQAKNRLAAEQSWAHYLGAESRTPPRHTWSIWESVFPTPLRNRRPAAQG